MLTDCILQFLRYDIAQVLKYKGKCLCCFRFPNMPFCQVCHSVDCPNDTAGENGSGDSAEYDGEDPADFTILMNELNPNTMEIAVSTDDDDCDIDGQDKHCMNAFRMLQAYANVYQKVVDYLRGPPAVTNVVEIASIEERAWNLWDILNSTADESNHSYPNWWDLKSWQKLTFYWASLSNEILSEDPFANFKQFYMTSCDPYNKDKLTTEQRGRHARGMWRALSSRQRMPFIMEAFIAKLAVGSVSIRNETEIQRVLAELTRC